MSDLFYPHDIAGDKHYDAVLQFIPQLTYTVKYTPGDPMAVVFEKASKHGAKSVIKTKIPAHYYEHLKRFLWKYYMLFRVYKVLHLGSKSVLTPSGIKFLECMLVLTDTVVEQLLLGCIALGDQLDEDSRIHYFDVYLTTEFVVGYHDPAHVEAWRMKEMNQDLDLEQMDPFTLDWAAYDAALGPVLGGEVFEMKVDALASKAICVRAIDAVSQWYQLRLRQVTARERKMATSKTQSLVNGTAGMDLQMVQEGGGIVATQMQMQRETDNAV